jgi:hypothetical protein
VVAPTALAEVVAASVATAHRAHGVGTAAPTSAGGTAGGALSTGDVRTIRRARAHHLSASGRPPGVLGEGGLLYTTAPSPQDGGLRYTTAPAPQDCGLRYTTVPAPHDGELRSTIAPAPPDDRLRYTTAPAPILDVIGPRTATQIVAGHTTTFPVLPQATGVLHPTIPRRELHPHRFRCAHRGHCARS